MSPDPQRETRQQQIRGLVWIALAILLCSILRAGVHRVFGTGRWRLW